MFWLGRQGDSGGKDWLCVWVWVWVVRRRSEDGCGEKLLKLQCILELPWRAITMLGQVLSGLVDPWSHGRIASALRNGPAAQSAQASPNPSRDSILHSMNVDSSTIRLLYLGHLIR